MFNIYHAFIFLIVVVIILIIINSRKTTILKGNYNGIIFKFNVIDTDNDISDQLVANMLARINVGCQTLITYLNHTYPNDKRTKLLSKKYDDDDISESSSTYTTNKGDSISLCMRDSHQNIYSYNILMFITIHELSHIICNNYISNGVHDEEFNKNNEWLIQSAIKCGAWTYHDFIKYPINYCGHIINYNII